MFDLKQVSQLEDCIDYTFQNKKLLFEALTHPSIKQQKNYQRLEFLGNGILNAIIAEMIYNLFPDAAEGKLSIIHSKMVSTQGIVTATQKIEIGQYMLMHSSEVKNNGKINPRNIEDCVEALIGAIYLDGGYNSAILFVKRFWSQKLQNSDTLHTKDAKSRLQEACQKTHKTMPQYEVIHQSGLCHAPKFEVVCIINTDEKIFKIHGEGGNRKNAEQNAAIKMLELLS